MNLPFSRWTSPRLSLLSVALAWLGSTLAVASPGDLYLTNYATNTIMRLKPDGTQSLFATASSGLNGPVGLAFDGNGNLFVANFRANNVVRFTPDGSATIFASHLAAPSGLAFDSAGNLFVANYGDSTIHRIASTGEASLFGTSAGFYGVNGLAFDAPGNLYAANWNFGTVEKFTPAGERSTFASELGRPEGLAFDDQGNLFAAIQYGISFGQTIRRFGGDAIGSLFGATAGRPSGLAFAPDGQLYAMNFDIGVLERFSADGIASTFWTGEIGQGHLAFEPNIHAVPEPNAWAMAAMGLALLGAAHRYRSGHAAERIRVQS